MFEVYSVTVVGIGVGVKVSCAGFFDIGVLIFEWSNCSLGVLVALRVRLFVVAS